MKGLNLKYKIAVKFCIAVASIVGIIVMVVSLQLDQGISKQSKILVKDMTTQTYKGLDSHIALIRSFVQKIIEDVRRSTREIGQSLLVLKYIESHPDLLADLIKSYCEQSRMDYVFVYDTGGKLQASFPRNFPRVRAEEFYKSWKMGTDKQELLKFGGKENETKRSAVIRHDIDFMKSFTSIGRSTSNNGGISIASAEIVKDDYGDLMGVCIMGKLFNGYDIPFQELYDITGASSVLYLDNVPIAHGGFKNKGKEDFDDSVLKISSEVVTKVNKTDVPIEILLELAGKKYLTKCFSFGSNNGEKVGVVCVGVTEHQVVQTQQGILSYSVGTKKSVQAWLIGIGAISVIAFIILSLVITGGIVRPVNRVIEGLMGSVDQVGSSSAQIASSSQSLAEGASEQASGIEETSSSLEEMASMTRKNAENANQANTLMADTSRVVDEANHAMKELTQSMNEISTSSEETGKIIKTIDEIAFQTNLLALNAAVEAARAGEAGAGFAVVANEVKNLAMRAAEAAKNTANLIEGTVKRIKSGSEIVSKTNEAFGKVATGAKKVGQLVGEISAASQEQAQGIEQVNRAVAEMDKVVQKNAASAEESASASEEMNTQAEQMKDFVGELVMLVSGGSNGNGMLSQRIRGYNGDDVAQVSGASHQPKAGVRKILSKAKAVRPDQVIPMEEADFKEF